MVTDLGCIDSCVGTPTGPNWTIQFRKSPIELTDKSPGAESDALLVNQGGIDAEGA